MGQNASVCIETSSGIGRWHHECYWWTMSRRRDMYAEMQNDGPWPLPEDAAPQTVHLCEEDGGCQPGSCSPDELIALVGRYCPNDPEWLAVCAAAKAYEDGGKTQVRIVWWFDQ